LVPLLPKEYQSNNFVDLDFDDSWFFAHLGRGMKSQASNPSLQPTQNPRASQLNRSPIR
jgi:hypothetical protein